MSEQPLIDANEGRILSLNDETVYAPNGIASRTVLASGAARVVLFGFDTGQELTEHTTTRPALVQILSGECEFSMAGASRHLSAGELVYLPAHCPHAVRATRKFSMLLTLLSSPEARPKGGSAFPVLAEAAK